MGERQRGCVGWLEVGGHLFQEKQAHSCMIISLIYFYLAVVAENLRSAAHTSAHIHTHACTQTVTHTLCRASLEGNGSSSGTAAQNFSSLLKCDQSAFFIEEEAELQPGSCTAVFSFNLDTAVQSACSQVGSETVLKKKN